MHGKGLFFSILKLLQNTKKRRKCVYKPTMGLHKIGVVSVFSLMGAAETLKLQPTCLIYKS